MLLILPKETCIDADATNHALLQAEGSPAIAQPAQNPCRFDKNDLEPPPQAPEDDPAAALSEM